MSREWRLSRAAMGAGLCGLLATTASLAQDPAKDVGRWEPNMQWHPNQAGAGQFFGVHLILLRDGRVLAIDNRDFGSFNPATNTFLFHGEMPVQGNFFCGGHAMMPDGRVLFMGGGAQPGSRGCKEDGTSIDADCDGIDGCDDPDCSSSNPDQCCDEAANDWDNEWHPYAATFDVAYLPQTEDPGSPSPWSQTDALPDLDGSGLERRWYPTLTALGDGTMLLTAGSFGIGIDTLRGQYIPAVYDPQQPAGQRWERLGEPPYDEASPPFKVVHYYPFMHQISDGTVFMAGGPYFDETRDASIHLFTYTLNVGTETWCGCDSDVRWKAAAPGGSACMFSLDKIIKGGTTEIFGKPSLKTVEWMDMSPGATHDWLNLPDMRNARQFFYMVPLPDGRVLAIGGYNSTVPGPVRKPEWLVPTGIDEDWLELSDIDVNGTLAERREYHSASVLLPDGRVLISGGQYGGPVVFQKTAQIFRPPYLYNSSNQYLDDVGGRPVINFGTTPDTISYLKQFNINLETTDAGDVSKVCLIRLGAATHSVDQNTRRIELSFTDTSTTRLRVSAPAGPAAAPPGYYMLFVLKPSNDGRENIHFPSKAKIVKVQMQSL